jgi:hypothetical protein
MTPAAIMVSGIFPLMLAAVAMVAGFGAGVGRDLHGALFAGIGWGECDLLADLNNV